MRTEQIKQKARALFGEGKQTSAFIQGAIYADDNPTHSDINKLAAEAYTNAILRGKTDKTPSHENTTFGIFDELKEFRAADEKKLSEHLPQYTEAQEELADILIVCLTELHSRGVDVEKIITDKINFNKTR